MTLLIKPVTRQSACQDRGVPLVVTLHSTYLELRWKGTRKSYAVHYLPCLKLAVEQELQNQRREKQQTRKGRKP